MHQLILLLEIKQRLFQTAEKVLDSRRNVNHLGIGCDLSEGQDVGTTIQKKLFPTATPTFFNDSPWSTQAR